MDEAVTNAAEAGRVLGRALADLPDPLAVVPPVRERGRAPIDVSVRPPGSKSLTNRVLLLAALARGESTVRRGLLGADDAERMLTALAQLGARIDRSDEAALRITGVGGRWRTGSGGNGPGGVELNLNNAGTATRFLSAAALLADGPVTIDGNERMRQRPIGELGTALETLGARIEFLGDAGCPPMRITPPEGNRPAVGVVELGPTQSSQFISALLLVAPMLPGGLTLKLTGGVTSASYVRMTVGLLGRLGVRVRASADLSVLQVSEADGGAIGWFDETVEPDASGATYWHAAGCLLRDATVRVVGLPGPGEEDGDGAGSLQGDAAFPEVLTKLGAGVVSGWLKDGSPTVAVRGVRELRPVMVDMSDMPDAVMSLAACCAFAGGTSIVRGVRTLRVKETDRIEALRVELGKIGVEVTPTLNGDDDVLSITPPAGGVDCSAGVSRVEFDTYDDHRMAMSLALIGLRRPNVWIREPGCVAKTYPGYWADLAKLYA